MSIITRFDPLTYGVDGLRGALINTWHFSMAFDVAATRDDLPQCF